MALDLTRITEEVAEQETVVASASALLTQLAQLVRDTAGDPVAVAALADRIDAQNAALAAAVAANTPGAPPA